MYDQPTRGKLASRHRAESAEEAVRELTAWRMSSTNLLMGQSVASTGPSSKAWLASIFLLTGSCMRAHRWTRLPVPHLGDPIVIGG